MLDTDERWEQVPDEHIEACTTGLSFFDPESWRYYIAPFMIWALRHLGKTNLFVLDSTIYTFDPSEKHPELAEYAMERFSLLNESQSRAVCCFLRFMARNGDYADDRVARDALRKYWGTFCPDDSV